MQCNECQGEFEYLESFHDGDEIRNLCGVCGGFPNREYSVKCPHCELYILVN